MQWEKVELAARMQNYIRDHCMDADFTMDALYEAAGYSRRHACRIFKELMDKTPEEYVRAVQMTASAESLIKTDSTILDIALDTNFESHEGYTRAFNKLFGTTPSRYRHGQVPIPLFVQSHSALLLLSKTKGDTRNGKSVKHPSGKRELPIHMHCHSHP